MSAFFSPKAQRYSVTASANKKHRLGVVLRRLKFIGRFIYWTCKHRSTANAAWVCNYEGYKWN